MTFSTKRSVIVDKEIFIVKNNEYDNSTTAAGSQLRINNPEGSVLATSLETTKTNLLIGASAESSVQASSGAVYILTKTGSLIRKIKAPTPINGALFGSTLAVGHGILAVGAINENTQKGAVYIFKLNGDFIRRIEAPDPLDTSRFGQSLSVANSKIYVSRPFDANNRGAVYIFDLGGNFLRKITAFDSQPSDRFSISLSAGGNRLIVGSDFNDQAANNAGAAYLYDSSGVFISKILPNSDINNGSFGKAVSINSGLIGITNGPTIFQTSLRGAAFIYDLNGNFKTKIQAPNAVINNNFGASISIGSGRIVVGADGDSPLSNTDRGSAYVFDLKGNFMERLLPGDLQVQAKMGFEVKSGDGTIISLCGNSNGLGGQFYVYTIPDQPHYLDQVINIFS